MTRQHNITFAVVISAGLALGGAVRADAQTKFVAPLRGEVDLEYTKPVTKVEGNLVKTTIVVRNPSATGSIAGLKVDEYWYDKGGDPVTGDTFRYRKPLLPGEIIVVSLNTPKNPKMNRNSYNFSHANGAIKTKLVPKLTAPAAPAAPKTE